MLAELVLFENDVIPVKAINEASIVSFKTNFSDVVSHTSSKPSSSLRFESTSLKLTNLVGGDEALDNTLITFCDPIRSFVVAVTL